MEIFVLAVDTDLIIVPALYEPLLTCVDYSAQINMIKTGTYSDENIINESLL